jgi:Mor family transcriptional regulator
MRCIFLRFQAGTIRRDLAKQYGISESSVSRILRKMRAASQ